MPNTNDAGHRSLEDLRVADEEDPRVLTRVQKIGLRYFKEIEAKIPREECTAIAVMVQTVATRIFPGIECTATGSYRRGKQASGDVDIMVTHRNFKVAMAGSDGQVEPDTESENTEELKLGSQHIYSSIIQALSDEGFLTEHLATAFGVQGCSDMGHFGNAGTVAGEVPHPKYMGICVHPKFGNPRRLDMIVVPYKEKAFALL